MIEHTREDLPRLAHSLIAAHPDRVRAFAARYAAMADTVAARGAHARESGARQIDLVRTLSAWDRRDWEAEVADRVELVGDDRAAAARGIQTALAHVDLLDDDERDEVTSTLRRALEAPEPLPRAWIPSLRRYLRRQERVLALNGPTFLLVNEARLLASLWMSCREPPLPWAETVSWDRGCQGLLRAATHAVAIVDASGRRGVDLGVGGGVDVSALLGLDEASWEELLDAHDAGPTGPSLESLVPELGSAPLVPPRRFHDRGPSFTEVRDHGEDIGPLGWAEGDELLRLADDFASLARRHPAQASALTQTAAKVREAHRAGHAVLGCIERMTYEGDGVRTWLVSPDDDEP